MTGTEHAEDLSADTRVRHRRRFVAAAVCAVAVAVAGVGVTALVMGPDDGSGPSAGSLAEPVPVPWWTDGVLHLGTVQVPADDLASETLEQVTQGGRDAGVVYGTDDGEVVHVSPAGRRTTLGAMAAGGRVHASGPHVAWVDPGRGRQAARLVTAVVSAQEGPVVQDSVALPRPGLPVAITGPPDGPPTFWVDSDAGTYSWRPDRDDAPVRVGPPGSLAAGSGTTLARPTPSGDRLRVTSPQAPDGAFEMPGGYGVVVAADGSYLAMPPAGSPDDPPVVVRRADGGAVRLEDGLLTAASALTFVPGTDTAVLVAPSGTVADSEGDPVVVDLVVCDLVTASCRPGADDVGGEDPDVGRVLLAQ